MAITDLFINAGTDRSVVYPSWVCRIGADGYDIGSPEFWKTFPPYLTGQIRPDIKPRKVSRTAGGAIADSASYEWIDGTPLTDRLLQPGKFSKMSDVLLPSRQFLGTDDDGYRLLLENIEGDSASVFAAAYLNDVYGTNIRLLVGDYVTESESVDATETLNAQVSVSESMYGVACDGMMLAYVYDPEDPKVKESIEISGEIVFNPEVDGEVRGNKSSNFETLDHYWIPPEVSESAALQTYLRQSVSMWTLPESVVMICKLLNADEKYIRNPVIDEEDELWSGAPEIKNLRLPTGNYLPFYLDAILHPAGYNWWLDPETEKLAPEGEFPEVQWEYEKPIIRIFRKGWSPDPPKELNFQAPGSVLDLAESNVNQYRIDRKISDAYNCVRVLGDKIRVEATWQLGPAWRESEDAISRDDLSISEGAQYAAHKTAHRLWVANESGIWTGIREFEFLSPRWNPQLFQVVSPSGNSNGWIDFNTPRKLVLEPPLTYQGSGDDKVRRDILLQYSTDHGETWNEISSAIGGWAVLGDQIGIVFTDDKPPQVIYDAFSEAGFRMQVTGTVASPNNYYNHESDTPVAENSSAILRPRRLDLDRSNEFRHWYVLGKNNPAGGSYAGGGFMESVLKDDVAGAETHDDRQALYDYAAATLRNVMHAEYDADFTLPGWHTEYKIGDLLSKINGREVGLNQSADAEDPRYLQITGIEWELSDEEGPTTRIIVDRGINDVKRTATPEFGPVPISEIVAYEVQSIMRSEAAKADANANTGSSAMDRLRGTIR